MCFFAFLPERLLHPFSVSFFIENSYKSEYKRCETGRTEKRKEKEKKIHVNVNMFRKIMKKKKN